MKISRYCFEDSRINLVYYTCYNCEKKEDFDLMRRRICSCVLALALCLNLIPQTSLAAARSDADGLHIQSPAEADRDAGAQGQAAPSENSDAAPDKAEEQEETPDVGSAQPEHGQESVTPPNAEAEQPDVPDGTQIPEGDSEASAQEGTPPQNTEQEQPMEPPATDVPDGLMPPENGQAAEAVKLQRPEGRSARRTHTVDDSQDLREFVDSGVVQDGDTIILNGMVQVNDPKSNSDPWVINKSITIQGGQLKLRAGGILLGSDVTFQDTELMFTNPIRNVIMANGHRLELENVTQGSGAKEVHLLAGGLSGHTVSASEGGHGEIIISGNTSLGNIYAGSLSSQGNDTTWTGDSTIVIDRTASGKMGELYASGARETYADPDQILNPDYKVDPPTADADRYPTTGWVDIKLYKSVVTSVDGRTGGDENAHITYNGDDNLQSSWTLKEIASFDLQTGNVQFPASMDLTNVDLAMGADTKMDLSLLPSKLQIKNFTSSGTLILDAKQTLTITGAVGAGVTSVGIGRIWNGFSGTAPVKNHPYISAQQSGADSFKLVPTQMDQNAVFTRDSAGNWMVYDGAGPVTVQIDQISVAPNFAFTTADTDVLVPITVTYSTGADEDLALIPLNITVNGVSAQRTGDADSGYSYSAPGQKITLLEFYLGDDGTMMQVVGDGTSGELAQGSYRIGITVNKQHMASGKPAFLNTVLDVSGGTVPGPDPVQKDLSKADVQVNGTYTYNGQAQLPDVTVTLEGHTLQRDTDYTVTAVDNTDAGEATATIAPAAGSGYTGSKSVQFTIQKAQLAYQNVTIAPKTYDGTATASVEGITFYRGGSPADTATLHADTDYTVTATFNSPNVSAANQVTVEVRLTGAAKNYNLQTPVQKLSGQSIRKAELQAVPGSMDIRNGTAASYTFQLMELMPKLDGQLQYGGVTFRLGTVNLPDYYTSGANVLDTELTLPIQSVTSSKEGKVGDVSILVETENYTVKDAVIQVFSVNRKVLHGEPVLSSDTLKLGRPLSDIRLTGGMQDEGGKVVNGSFAWDAPATIYPVGSHYAAWTFTPADAQTYAKAHGTVKVTVEAPVLHGEPTLSTKTLEPGRPLSDIQLSGQMLDQDNAPVSGSFAWDAPNTVYPEGNHNAPWTFTPTDAQKYTQVHGTIEVIVQRAALEQLHGEPTLSTDTLESGRPLSDIQLSGSMLDQHGAAVDGSFAWDAPDTVFSAGSHRAPWTFTPANSQKYVQAHGTAEITVSKRAPVIVPNHQTITKPNQTLADAKLTLLGGSADTAGRIAWTQDAAATIIQAGTSYGWIFTPNDGDYAEKTANVLLYTENSGGCSSSAAASAADGAKDSSAHGRNAAKTPSGFQTTVRHMDMLPGSRSSLAEFED